ncbi:hypothetical protein TNCV_71061 [Trichonephila clavipes]|nr:hypothetical protein TNCV_71061 [Trichonephila clavipes]
MAPTNERLTKSSQRRNLVKRISRLPHLSPSPALSPDDSFTPKRPNKKSTEETRQGSEVTTDIPFTLTMSDFSYPKGIG